VAGCVRLEAPPVSIVPAAETLLSRIAMNSAAFRSLDGEAQVALKHEGRYYPSHQFLLIEKPDRIRVDVLTSFGQLLLQLASDGENLSVLTSSPSRYMIGLANDENIYRFVRIPLSAQDLIALMLYSPPVIAYTESDVNPLGDEFVLSLSGKGQSQRIKFDDELRPFEIDFRQDDELLLKVAYRRFNAIGFPEQMIIEVPQQELRVKLSLSAIQLNTLIDEAKFHITKPDDVPLEVL
jgi:outer membrane lipoprotein-sorting protein